MAKLSDVATKIVDTLLDLNTRINNEKINVRNAIWVAACGATDAPEFAGACETFKKRVAERKDELDGTVKHAITRISAFWLQRDERAQEVADNFAEFKSMVDEANPAVKKDLDRYGAIAKDAERPEYGIPKEYATSTDYYRALEGPAQLAKHIKTMKAAKRGTGVAATVVSGTASEAKPELPAKTGKAWHDLFLLISDAAQAGIGDEVLEGWLRAQGVELSLMIADAKAKPVTKPEQKTAKQKA